MKERIPGVLVDGTSGGEDDLPPADSLALLLHALTRWESPADLAQMIRHTLFSRVKKIAVRVQLLDEDGDELKLVSVCDEGALIGYLPPTRIPIVEAWPSTLTLRRGAVAVWSSADLEGFPGVQQSLAAPAGSPSGLDVRLAQVPLQFGSRLLGVISIGLAAGEVNGHFAVQRLQFLASAVSLWAAAVLGARPAKRGVQALDALSGRQRDIVELISQGLTTSGIARQLHVSEALVKLEVRRIKDIVGADSRTQIARLFTASAH